MKIFNRDEFIELSKKEADLFVSIYSPTSRRSTDAYQKDILTFKNTLSEIEKKLIQEGVHSPIEIDRILEPAKTLINQFSFWQHNSDMLAVFLYDGKIEVFKLPLEIDSPNYFVGSKPMLLPMLPELADDGHYYILLLNLDQIRLYEATRNVVQEIQIDPEKVAVSFTAEEDEADKEKNLQAQGRVGNAGAMYHGHGSGSDEEKKVTILNYFHRMTNMLEPMLNSNPLPVVLAGVDYLIPIFNEASKYGHIYNDHVSGAFTEKDMMELHQKSWELIESFFAEARKKRKETFQAFKVKGQASSNDQTKIIHASFTGAVETLLVNRKHQHVFGYYDEETHQVNISENQQNGAHCLIDEAATKVIASKGKVYLAAEEDMPEDSQVAAVFRYPL
ncbi:MAG: baeRF7 domain-containing protein [Cecembia sp.]